MKKHVCVIGAGVAGLVSIKECLEEGHEVTCYEQYDDIGGTWYYSEQKRPNQGGSVYSRMHCNTSKEMTRFSDFPVPDHYPLFMPHETALEYLRSYAKEFDLLKHVKFETEVLDVKPADDYDVTGKWVIVTSSKTSGKQERSTYDAVLVASGYFKNEHLPHIPGQETFPGGITHSKSYRRSEDFQGKTVVVVGNSFSAGDVATDVAFSAKKVYLAVGEGTWAFRYIKNNGEPTDWLSRSFYKQTPEKINQALRQVASENIDHYKTGLAGTKEPCNQAFMLVDNLGKLIGSGKLIVQGFLERFDGQIAVFSGGVTVPVDDVIMATGYTPEFSFLDESVVAGDFKKMRLYKLMWPSEMKHPTLAVIGCLASNTSLWPVFELQARWAALVLSGKRHLPSKSEMMKDIDAFIESSTQQFGSYKLFTAAIPYEDELAKLIGCYPKFWDYALSDPKLAWALWKTPVFPVQYRLTGPHPRSDAREEFLKTCDSLYKPIKNRKVAPPSKKGLFF